SAKNSGEPPTFLSDPKNLDKLDDDLRDRNLEFDAYTQSDLFRRFSDESSWEDLESILRNEKRPLVRLAGYYAVRQKWPDKTFAPAVTLVLSSPPGDSVYLLAPAFEDLLKARPSRTTQNGLNDALKSKPERKAVAILVAAIPKDVMLDWIERIEAPDLDN